ncbi:MAG TPA: hypothetical protein VFY67_02015 [Pyrinomonadaceae bacterium]|nr:hypothetical protein [Pyrinomonadaceae bacterium]
MKTKLWSVVLIVICTPWHSAAAGGRILAQQSPQPESQKNAKPRPVPADEELQKRIREQQVTRILTVLRTTADNAKHWTDATAASKVQAQISDVIWDTDAEVARLYLIRAWETAGKVEISKRERSAFRNQSPRTEARREVILVARKRAPDLSNKWLQQMAEESEQDPRERGTFDDRTPRSTLLLQMALQIVDQDPEAAATLVIDSLQDGISFGFQQVLIRIQEKKVELSQNVFRAALSRLKTAGMLDPNELLILFAYLYTPGRVIAANTDGNTGRVQIAVGRDRPQIAAAAQLNPALALEFLQLAANLLISAPPPATTANPSLAARTQLSAINTLMVPISERLPDLAVALRTRAQQISTDAQLNTAPQSAPPKTPASRPGETSTSYAERRVDLLEEAARNENFTIGRDIAYAKAALATTVQNYSRGWDLAGKIEDRTLQENLKNWLTYRATLHFVRVDNLDRAYELAAKNNDPIQRAASLVAGAQQLIKIKDTTRASQWLVEARSLVRKVDPDETSVHVSFGIVSAFGKFDRVSAFEVFSEAVRQMGKTTIGSVDEDRAPLLKRFSGFESLADFTYGTEGFSLRAAVSAFGPEQFEDVLGIVNRITPAELHGLAIIELSRKYLKATEKI